MEKHNHTLMDQKCPTCGNWMKTGMATNSKGIRTVTYVCNECGLNYSIEG